MAQTPSTSAARRPLYAIVSSLLADRIRSGALADGTVIREKAIGALFGIGRMPVAHALSRLEQEKLVHRRPPMHGVVVGRNPRAPLRAGIDLTGLALPPEVDAELRVRNWRTLVYPGVERDVASCLLFGRFQIRSQALAEHFGVSRTIANELLLRLERVGLVRQERNARWYAGPLTLQRIGELYELRLLLEPEALRQAARCIDPPRLDGPLDRLEAAGSTLDPKNKVLLHQVEVDLHHGIVLSCGNEEMRNTLYRCQLPLITVHLSFDCCEAAGARQGIAEMLDEHRQVIEALQGGEVEAAAAALARHLRISAEGSAERLARLRPIDHARLPPYLDPV